MRPKIIKALLTLSILLLILFDNLVKLLENNPNGWKTDINTYAPNHLFVSDNLIVNVTEGGVIINYSANPLMGNVQVSKRINALSQLFEDVSDERVMK